MPATIDLNTLVEVFLDEAVRRQREECQELDAPAVCALNEASENLTSRTDTMLRWLRSYSVYQGFEEEDRRNVASAVIEFADARNKAATLQSDTEIIKLFDVLHEKCRQGVKQNRDGQLRDLSSLSSKALWCCYPNIIPIYDSFAERALWIISRLMQTKRPDAGSRYSRFVSVWRDAYRRVSIDDDRLHGYPYKVRVFDKILWIIGQRDFGVIPYLSQRAKLAGDV